MMTLIAVVGAGKCDPAMAAIAEEVGRLLAQRGFVVVCGGRGGVMEAVCRGAKGARGLTIGILPTADSKTANRWVDIPIPTALGEARNFIVVRSAQAVIAVGGEYGTLSEIALALKFGIPVVGINTWQFAKGGPIKPHFPEATNAAEAVEYCLQKLSDDV